VRWSQGGGLAKPVARLRRMEQWGVQQRRTAATTSTVTRAARVSSLYSNNADACESLDLVDARRLDSLETSWFAVAFTEGDLARLVELSIGMVGGGARLVCRP